jgi:ribosomal protein S2
MKTKLLKLKLIQTKTFTKKQNTNNIKIEDIECRLKKSLQVIYKYHIFKKRILFVGASYDINLKFKIFLSKTKHIFLPSNLWIKGAINNKTACFKHLLSNNSKNFNNKISELLIQLKKNIDLIVILDKNESLNIINEGYNTRIPIISFDNNFNLHNNQFSYAIPGNSRFLKKKVRDKFFYSLLISTLKKGNKYKISRPKKMYSQQQKHFKFKSYNNKKYKNDFKK